MTAILFRFLSRFLSRLFAGVNDVKVNLFGVEEEEGEEDDLVVVATQEELAETEEEREEEREKDEEVLSNIAWKHDIAAISTDLLVWSPFIAPVPHCTIA